MTNVIIKNQSLRHAPYDSNHLIRVFIDHVNLSIYGFFEDYISKIKISCVAKRREVTVVDGGRSGFYKDFLKIICTYYQKSKTLLSHYQKRYYKKSKSTYPSRKESWKHIISHCLIRFIRHSISSMKRTRSGRSPISRISSMSLFAAHTDL